MSTLEAVAILTALVAGLGIGLTYMGHDVGQVLSLTQGELKDAAGESDEGPTTAADSNAQDATSPAVPTEAQDPQQTAQQIRQLQNELARLRSQKQRQSQTGAANGPTTGSQPQSNPPVDYHSVDGRRTLDYWLAMNAVIRQEASMRLPPSGGLTAANAADFVHRRTEAGNYANEALRGLDASRVDREVARFALDLAAWYDMGAKIASRADALLTHGSVDQRQGSLGEQWADAEKRHSAAVAQINRRGAQIQASMSRKYALAFPDLE
jgi:hypothetical protein